jgi:hypothetical protein
MEELMQYAKGSQCACYVCATLRKMLIAQLYSNLQLMKQQLKDMEDAKES